MSEPTTRASLSLGRRLGPALREAASKPWAWPAVGLGAVVIASLIALAALRPAKPPEGFLYGNGRIEGDEVRIAAEVSGRVAEAPFEEGMAVGAGDLLARIDDADYALELDRAEAALTAAHAGRQRTERELEAARHHLVNAETEAERVRDLEARGTAPPRAREQAENALEEARAHVGALEAGLIEAGASIEAASRARDLAGRAHSKTTITAPLDATVLVKAAQPGELVGPGAPVAVLLDLEDLELKVYVPERELGRFALGAEARVYVDAFPERPFSARVASVDPQAQFTPRDVHMPDERVRTVFGVTLAVENEDGALKPGMPADAWIRTDPDSPWPDRFVAPG